MSTPTRFVAVGDNHGDMVDEESFLAVQQFIKDYKPSVRVHLGDCFDFRSLRRGVGNDAESAESLKEDLECGIEFLNISFLIVSIHLVYKFSKIRHVFHFSSYRPTIKN